MSNWKEQHSGAIGWRLGLPAALLVLTAGAVTAAIMHDRGETRVVTLTAGTMMVGALEHSVSTEVSHVGDQVQLQTVEPVSLDGETIIPKGSTIRGEVTGAKRSGRVACAPELTLRFTELESGGATYRIDAVPFRVRGTNDAAQSAEEAGGGAVAGGVLGAVLGGGGGAVKGAVLGAAIGTGVAIATPGDQLTLPKGQHLRIRLAAPVNVSCHVGRSN
jgi:hypothetical protein